MTPAEQEAIRRTFERKMREIDVLVRETARLLSETTRLTAVISGPQMEKATFQELRLVPLGADKAVLIYITDSGFVENQVLDVPFELTMLELQQISDVLNEQLRGQRVESLSRTALQSLSRELSRYSALLEQTLLFLDRRVEPGERNRFYLGGTTNMLDQPEFRDVAKLRELLTLLEHEEVMADVLDVDTETEGVSVQIGEELRVRELSDCSVVSATYRLGDRVIGKMGVIGPKRMEYARVVSIMNAVTAFLTESTSRR